MTSKPNLKTPSTFNTSDLSWMVDVLHQVQSGISISDAQKPDFPLIFVNESFTKMTGYDVHEVIGQNCRFLQGEERNQPSREIIKKSILAGLPCEVVLRNFTKEGILFFNRLILSPVFDSENKLTHYIGIQNDITAQLRRESEIESQRHINEKLSKLASLGELSSAIVHEINSPMMILMSQIETMKESTTGLIGHEDLKIAISKCESAYERIFNIIKSLRSFSHDGAEYRIGKMDIAKQIDETLELCLPRLKGTPIQLVFNSMPGQYFAKLHCTQFSQVLVNLFNNAFDAIESNSQKNEGIIEIKLSTSQNNVYVDVIDSGPGVPLENRDLMFESFFTTKAVGKGTGLGLSLSRKFCEKMNGSLEYHDLDGIHFFRIKLPIE